MNLGNKITAGIRTVVPFIAGWLLAQPAAQPVLDWLGVSSDAARDWTISALTVIIGGLWHTVVQLVESHWPWAGVLLGIPAAPSYAAAAPSTDTASLLDVPDTPDPLEPVRDPNTAGASTPAS